MVARRHPVRSAGSSSCGRPSSRSPPGPYRYFRVTWDDTQQRPHAAAAGRLRAARDRGSRRRRRSSQRSRSSAAPSEPGRSRYHVTLPGSRLPIAALRFDAGGTYLFRGVTYEPRLAALEAAPVMIGQGLLVARSDRARRSAVPIKPPSQAGDRLVVEDGDNPPLEVRGVSAEFAELPWIYFDAAGPAHRPLRRCHVPRPSYDLEAARDRLRIDALPEASWQAATVGRSRRCRSTPPRSPAGRSTCRLPLYARDPGGPRRTGGPGARRRGPRAQRRPRREFADVRIVDGSGRQVPRLTERRPEPLVIPLRIESFAPRRSSCSPARTASFFLSRRVAVRAGCRRRAS